MPKHTHQVAFKQVPKMIHQTLVGELDSLEILHLFGKTVVAQNGSTQTQRIGRARRHVLHQTMFDLFQNYVQVLALSLLQMQLVVFDHHLFLTVLNHFGHLLLGFTFNTLSIDSHNFITCLQYAYLEVVGYY